MQRFGWFVGLFVAASLGATGAAAQASAPRVLLMHEAGPRAEALADALRVELAASRADVFVVPAPSGESVLMRAAAAQSAARASEAAFAIWVEDSVAEGAGDLLRVVDPQSDHIRDAPLPATLAAVSPQMFGVVAASLIGEHLDPDMATEVQVDVRVTTPNGEVAVRVDATDAAQPEPPTELAAPVVVVPQPEAAPSAATVNSSSQPPEPSSSATPASTDTNLGVMPREGFVLSAELATAFVATGGGVEVGGYLSRRLRLEAFAQGFVHYIDSPAPSGHFGLALTRVGAKQKGRFDIGGYLGFLAIGANGSTTSAGGTSGETSGALWTESQTQVYFGATTGLHLGWMWELSPSFALGLRLRGGAAMVFDGGSESVIPYGMLSFRTEIAP